MIHCSICQLKSDSPPIVGLIELDPEEGHVLSLQYSNTLVFQSLLFLWCFILVKCFVLRSWECLSVGIYSVFCLC